MADAEQQATKVAAKSRNERLMLLVFLALIAYTFSELWRFYADNRDSVKENTALLEQLHSPDTAMIRSTRVRASNPSNQPLTTIATLTASRQEIEFERFEPLSELQVKVWFEDVSYEQLANWINELEYTEGVSAVALNVERGNAQGTVSGQVELARLE